MFATYTAGKVMWKFRLHHCREMDSYQVPEIEYGAKEGCQIATGMRKATRATIYSIITIRTSAFSQDN